MAAVAEEGRYVGVGVCVCACEVRSDRKRGERMWETGHGCFCFLSGLPPFSSFSSSPLPALATLVLLILDLILCCVEFNGIGRCGGDLKTEKSGDGLAVCVFLVNVFCVISALFPSFLSVFRH